MLVEPSPVDLVAPGMCTFKTTVLHYQGQINRFSLSRWITPLITLHAMTNQARIMVRTTAAAALGVVGL